MFKQIQYTFLALFIGAITLVGIFVAGGRSGTTLGDIRELTPSVVSVSPASLVSPSPNLSTPVTLTIPSINVNASIEYVGENQKGEMDIPKKAENVAWYQYGFMPGEAGNAVLAGHLDTVSGQPAVFYNVDELKPGDAVIIKDINNNSLTFRVSDTVNYALADFPMQKVFGASDKQQLNLITCTGQFNNQTRLYSHRTVVYTQLEGT